MTKEEKIKEAYGEHWQSFNLSAKKCALNNNGWIGQLLEHAPKGIELDIYKMTFRPKILDVIEHNNGWTTVLSEKDYPIENYLRVEFILRDGTHLYGRYEKRMGGIFVDESKRFEHPEHKDVTHWQKILSFNYPIY